jgi:hypothetical protein
MMKNAFVGSARSSERAPEKGPEKRIALSLKAI